MRYNEARLEAFGQVYVTMLVEEVAAHPDEYGYPVADVPRVVGLMLQAISAKGIAGVNKGRAINRAMRATCGKDTFRAMDSWLKGGGL